MHDDPQGKLLGKIDTKVIDHFCRGQRGSEKWNIVFVADGKNVGRDVKVACDDQGRRIAIGNFMNQIRAGLRRQSFVVIDFLTPENLNTHWMNQVQMPDLIGGKSTPA